MSLDATPQDHEADALPPEVTEILARFARHAGTDAPTGTIQLEGHDPVPFAGWLDLMARVEELLAEAPDGRVP